jgi:hypothetical protein
VFWRMKRRPRDSRGIHNPDNGRSRNRRLRGRRCRTNVRYQMRAATKAAIVVEILYGLRLGCTSAAHREVGGRIHYWKRPRHADAACR